jgi:transposase
MNGKPTSNLTEGAWRHGLADREWVRLRPLLPSRARTGRPPKDRRMIIGALLWLSRTGAPWRDLPERFGPWRTAATRFYRWTRSGLWEHLLAELRRSADAAGGKGGASARRWAAAAAGLAARCT